MNWTVASGSGEFWFPDAFTRTAADGVAKINFRPTRPGPTTVIATVDGVQGSPATLTVLADGPVVVLIRSGPLSDCSGNDPSIFGGPEGTIPVGALVEWEYMDWVHATCEARVRSLSVPPGGLPFDSGILQPGERFGIVLPVAGDWEVEDVINGGKGTLRVR